MNFKITTLVENCVYGRSLQSEHGLSLLIETGNNKKILFDTGQSDIFIENSKLLQKDIEAVDILILSHGHSDHTGGLQKFMELNSKASIVCKKEILQRKFKETRENGIRFTINDFSRFHFVEQLEEICTDLFVCPQIPIKNDKDTHFDHFYTEKFGIREPDTFNDELGLILCNKKNLSIISACSHRGITNLMEEALKHFPELIPDLVLGGFHIRTATIEKYQIIANYFKKHPVKRIGISHCTGVEQYARFVSDLKNTVFYNQTGNILEC